MGPYDRIKELCKNRNISIAALEKELGFSNGSIGKMRKSTPSIERLQKIADYFGVSLDFLYKEPYTSEAPVGTFAPDTGYYTDMETAKLAQRLFQDPKYRVLFDAADGAPVEDLQIAADMLRRFKEARGE